MNNEFNRSELPKLNLTWCMPFLFLFQMVKKKSEKKKSLPSCKRAHKTRPDLVILHSDCQTSPRTLLKCSRLLRWSVLTWIYAQKSWIRSTGSPEETKSNRCARGQRSYANHHFLLRAAKWPICGPLSGRNMDLRLKKGIHLWCKRHQNSLKKNCMLFGFAHMQMDWL